MRFAFVTCVQLGFACMEEIYSIGGKLDFVITLKDELAKKKSGRVYIDNFCCKHDINLIKVKSINDEEAVCAIKSGIDWLFVIGWSQMVRDPVLQAPKRGVLGMHPTLLPVGRGRAPIPWAILRGLSETGVTLFKLEKGVDSGPILAQERIPVAPDETATTLYRRTVEAHRNLIARIWPDLIHERIKLIPQDERYASEWPGRKPEDGQINPEMSVKEVERLVRAVSFPYPGAFWEDNHKVIRIWSGIIGNQAETPPDGSFRIELCDGVYDALNFEVE